MCIMKYLITYFTFTFIIGILTSLISIYGSTLEYKYTECKNSNLTHKSIFLIFAINNLIFNNVLQILYFIFIRHVNNQKKITKMSFRIFLIIDMILYPINIFVITILCCFLFQLEFCYGFRFLEILIHIYPFYEWIKDTVFCILIKSFMDRILIPKVNSD